VVASAGFGAVFGYRIGIEHSYLLAGLTVLFAVALEGIKPLAVSAAFQAFVSWQLVRGVSLGVLGIVAVAYSLTSELALTAASRGDLAAHRASEAFQARANRDRYQRAHQELSQLKPTRPLHELEALVAKTKGRDCGAENGTGRWICQQSPYAAELGRAKRRQELEAITSSTETAAAPVKVADPGATSLATYLAALGITVPVDVIATWLNLVPVLALELGSALAMVLVTAVSQPRATSESPTVQVLQPVRPALPAALATERARVASQIVSHLKQHGSLSSSHRNLAKLIGADRNTVGRAIRDLAAAGVVAHASSKVGTVLRLVA
jgi:hypothetical protein